MFWQKIFKNGINNLFIYETYDVFFLRHYNWFCYIHIANKNFAFSIIFYILSIT